MIAERVYRGLILTSRITEASHVLLYGYGFFRLVNESDRLLTRLISKFLIQHEQTLK